MPGSLRLLSLLALALVVSSLGGCRWQTVRLLVTDFESSAVEGVRLWREAAADTWEPASEFVFLRTDVDAEGGESLLYAWLSGPEASHAVEIESVLRRLDEDAVEIRLFHPHAAEPARYRASTWNAAGESALSEAAQRF